MKSYLQKVLEEQEMQENGQVRPDNNKEPSVRLAIYDSLSAAPRVIDLSGQSYEELIDLLATKTYQFSHEKGGMVPFTVIKEVVENLIHAYFQEAVITILDDGNTIRISDQGPGINEKEKAFLPGFSTATSSMKKIIKGVGSGLPIVKEALGCSGGEISIEDNLSRGTVITLTMPARTASDSQNSPVDEKIQRTTTAEVPVLNKRQKRALFLVTELGEAGPSKIAAEIDISLSTAYRDLTLLEELDLIQSDEHGKRSLTTKGVQQLDKILNS